MSRFYEDTMDRRRDERLAEALGCTQQELDEQVWDIGENTSANGSPNTYLVAFEPSTDPAFLKKIGAERGWTTIPLHTFDEPDGPDED